MRTEYHTKQRQALYEFFKTHAQNTFTVNEVAQAVCAPNAIGKSTVYRLIAKMAEEEELNRYFDDNKKAVVYQYVDHEHGCDKHFHLKCTDCGKTIHLEDDESEAALRTILKDYQFSMDEGKTVLFGKCRKCYSESESR